MALVLCPSRHCHLSIKFYLNGNSSFKVIHRTRYRTNGRTDRWTKRRLYASPFGEHNKYTMMQVLVYYIQEYIMLT